MENPFFVLEQRLSSLERLILELCNTLQFLTATSLGPEQPIKIKAASAFLGIPVSTIYGLTSRREIPFYKKGKELLFLKSELIEWVKAGRKPTALEIKIEARKGVSRG
jgi:excisionase family DNA binding protein